MATITAVEVKKLRDLTGAEHDFDAIRQDPRFVAVTTVMA